MAFNLLNRNITLQGLNPITLSLIEGKYFGKATKIDKQGIVLQLIEGMESHFHYINLQPLLDQFKSIF